MSSLNFEFQKVFTTIAASAQKTIPKIQFAAAAVVTVGIMFNTPSFANPPERGSKQMGRMNAHESFVKNMHIKDPSLAYQGWCCDFSDGRMGDMMNELKEEQVKDEDGGFHYRVFVTRDIYGKDSHNPQNPDSTINHSYDRIIPPEGRWIDIPRNRLVGVDDIEKNCPQTDETCYAPVANVLWLSDLGDVFCYWPIQHWGKNESKPGATGNTADTVTRKPSRLRLVNFGPAGQN